MKHLIRAAALAAPLAAAPLVAGAAVVTDQQNANQTGTTALGVTTTDLGQTFTVGVTGIFAGFQANVVPSLSPDDLTVTLRTTSGGLPTSTILATAILTAADAAAAANDYIDFSSAGVSVSAGDVLAVIFSTTIGEQYIVDTDFDGTYAGGTRVASNTSGATFFESSGIDLTFTTFVDDGVPSEVPLPAAAPLMALGLAGFGLVARRRG